MRFKNLLTTLFIFFSFAFGGAFCLAQQLVDLELIPRDLQIQEVELYYRTTDMGPPVQRLTDPQDIWEYQPFQITDVVPTTILTGSNYARAFSKTDFHPKKLQTYSYVSGNALITAGDERGGIGDIAIGSSAASPTCRFTLPDNAVSPIPALEAGVVLESKVEIFGYRHYSNVEGFGPDLFGYHEVTFDDATLVVLWISARDDSVIDPVNQFRICGWYRHNGEIIQVDELFGPDEMHLEITATVRTHSTVADVTVWSTGGLFGSVDCEPNSSDFSSGSLGIHSTTHGTVGPSIDIAPFFDTEL